MSWWMWMLIAIGALVVALVAWDKRDAMATFVAGVIVACVLVLTIGIPLVVRDQHRWERWCASQGGHVVSDSDVVTTIGANGKPGVGVSTDHFCLSADGRVLGMH